MRVKHARFREGCQTMISASIIGDKSDAEAGYGAVGVEEQGKNVFKDFSEELF